MIEITRAEITRTAISYTLWEWCFPNCDTNSHTNVFVACGNKTIIKLYTVLLMAYKCCIFWFKMWLVSERPCFNCGQVISCVEFVGCWIFHFRNYVFSELIRIWLGCAVLSLCMCSCCSGVRWPEIVAFPLFHHQALKAPFASRPPVC